MTPMPILDYIAGDTLIFDVIVKDGNRYPADLTGATMTWSIMQADTPVYTATSAGGSPGIVFTNAIGGKARVTVPEGAFTTVGEFTSRTKVWLASGELQTVGSGRFVSSAA